jgi:hypothetical protein
MTGAEAQSDLPKTALLNGFRQTDYRASSPRVEGSNPPGRVASEGFRGSVAETSEDEAPLRNRLRTRPHDYPRGHARAEQLRPRARDREPRRDRAGGRDGRILTATARNPARPPTSTAAISLAPSKGMTGETLPIVGSWRRARSASGLCLRGRDAGDRGRTAAMSAEVMLVTSPNSNARRWGGVNAAIPIARPTSAA